MNILAKVLFDLVFQQHHHQSYWFKSQKSLYFCIDYCALNAVTVKNKYPIPLIFKTLKRLAKTVKYTKLDVIHAFDQIRMKKGHK